ncbi:MAG: flagellar export chaperone FliS [Candidatus Abyssobacteria bacterium SURF_5]|uniref:Flagellar export chaperone FliS n=1 Tax=Abyssobacteria bacterium (strain SURF_5) TaxID=2093360 RepID=A0A3A4NPQ7_ABYX5|nr:MAG: flagellar export chaperone FliS [Candidatus Abyssubacteria bacterium SURF_5]
MPEAHVLSTKAAKSYREEHVNALSQKELILMLYDGAIKFCTEAKEAIREKQYVQSHQLITRARNVILELLRILDMEKGGEVARNLQRLYVYIIARLIEVNLTKEPNLLDNVLSILRNLRSAWAEIDFEEAAVGRTETPHPDNPRPKMAGSACMLSVTA